MCGAGPIPYASQRTLHYRWSRKFIGKSVGEGKVGHMGGNRGFEQFGGTLAVEFCVSVALRAWSGTDSNCTSDS